MLERLGITSICSRACSTINEEQFERVTDKIRVAAGGDLSNATVAVWGLTFKARTDDLRDSPSLAIIQRLVAAGATVQAYDPTVDGPKPGLPTDITIAETAYTACKGADVLAVLTEWDEFRWLDIDQGCRRDGGPGNRRRTQSLGQKRLAAGLFRLPGHRPLTP